MNFTGLIIGFITLVAIGLGFLWVIKLEYYVGAQVAKAVGALGVLVVAASLFVSGFYPSALLGVIGGTIFWGATELPDQEKRVEAGMFKKNPRKSRTGEKGPK
jgi:hypothetical protein